MPYLILGLTLLAGFLLAGRWFASADPKTLVKTLKWVLIAGIAATAAFFLFTGRFLFAMAALPALLPWFIRLRRVARTAKAYHRMSQRGGKQSSGQASGVNTRYLHMELDHDSGVMWGTVVSGAYTGRNLHDLDTESVLQLLGECQRNDPESAQILEAYLDRERPDWRDKAGDQSGHQRTGGESPNNHHSSDMSRAEAYQVLGLEEGAPDDVVRKTYHRLIGHLHPDKGGSTFLAAKVNQAKDVLLDD